MKSVLKNKRRSYYFYVERVSLNLYNIKYVLNMYNNMSRDKNDIYDLKRYLVKSQ